MIPAGCEQVDRSRSESFLKNRGSHVLYMTAFEQPAETSGCEEQHLVGGRSCSEHFPLEEFASRLRPPLPPILRKTVIG